MGLIVIAGSALTTYVAWKRFEMLQKIQASEVADAAAVPLKDAGIEGLRQWARDVEQNETRYRIYILDMYGVDIIGRPLTERIERRVKRMASLGYLADSEGNPPPLMADPLRTSPQMIGPGGGVYTMFFDYARPFGLPGTPLVNLLLLGIALGVSALACWWLGRFLSQPVALLQTHARALAAGNLEVRVGEDITRRKDELGVLARDFDQMAERIRSLVASKETLLRYVSHELRSPLARLRVALTLARREGADSAREMERIERETERLDVLIGQILRLSRLSTDDPSLQPQKVDIAQLLVEVVEDARMEASADDKDVAWSPGAHAPVLGSPELLRSAIENILRNALRFTARHTKVEVDLQVKDREALVTVRDYGEGVPSEDLEKIFEPFYRVPGASDPGSAGGGLGLAITARAINLHGGIVRARNAVDRGLIVEISLPLAAT